MSTSSCADEPSPAIAAPSLVLLPGLDGTEILLRPFLRSLPAEWRTVVLTYPQSGPSDYDALLPAVLREIDDTRPPAFVLGWSFGGPLAIRAAALRPERIAGVVLVSTFVEPPMPWLRRAGPLLRTPIVGAIRLLRRLPLWLLRPSRDRLRQDKALLWRAVPAAALACRARSVARVDVRRELAGLRQPVLCLHAAADPVVPRRCAEQILKLCARVESVALRGRHFALYADAETAADATRRFVAARIGAETGGAPPSP